MISKYALIDANNDVVNIVLWDGVTPWTPPSGLTAIQSDTAQIGGTWDGTNFHPAPPPPVVVPQSVTRFQALAALSNANLLTQAQTATTNAGGVALLAWQNAQEFDRSSPTIAALGTALGLTSAQIDALFIAASQIKA